MRATQPLLDLLPPLLDGVFEDPPWSRFLDRLRHETQADYAALTFRPPGKPLNQVVHLYSGAASPPLVSQLYHEQLYATDPLPYYHLAEGRAYALHELLRAGEPLHDSYYRDFLVPSGMTAMRMMRVMEASGVNGWLNITRREGDFCADDDALLQAIAPYLRGALRNFVALEHERFNAAMANDAISRLAFGWFTLDASLQVLDCDRQGEALLAHSGILGRNASGRLTARPRALEQDITSAVRALAADTRSRPRALILSRDPWLDMLLMPIHKRSISAKPDPAIIAYVHGDNWSSADRCEQLAELFLLLPSEARLALALSRGMTITEAAAELGLTVETARNYSKKIYSKLGARGQSDLVRFVMRSVLAIA
jgi:DNA-binding CsgD family transcriptional regulator